MSLADDLTNDLDIFFDTSEFAKEAKLIFSDGMIEELEILPVSNYDAFNFYGIEVAGTDRTCLVKSSELEQAAQGDRIEFEDLTYYITGIHPDDSGLTLLVLSKRSG